MDDCTLIAVPAWGTKLVDDAQRVVVHEGRYFRAGKIGVLCVDGVGPRVRRILGEEEQEEQEEQGDNNEEEEDQEDQEDQDPIGEPQFQFIEEQLKVNSSKNSSKNNNPVQVLVVVLHNPLTGRRNNDPEVK